MQDHQEAMVKSLVAVAWADGKMDSNESQVIDALIAAFALEGPDAALVREYAQESRTLEAIPLTDLSAHDRRMLLQHAVILTWVDGVVTEAETKVIDELVERLHLPEEEAKELRATASARAEKLVNLL